MALLPVLTAPDPILKKKSVSISAVDDNTRKLMDSMLETMYHEQGVGLAAPQIGTSQKIIVIDLQEESDGAAKKSAPLFIANPEIIEKSTELVLAHEGCLSLPEQRIEIARAYAIRIKFLDYSNEPQELEANDWLARVIQHEIDHLEGVLLVDYLSMIKRDATLRKLRKLKKQNYCL